MNANGGHGRAGHDRVGHDGGGHGHEHGAHEHEHHVHDDDVHDRDHGQYALEAREKQVVMSFIEALVEQRLSVNARRAVFGILSLDPSLREAGE